jgi:DNA modification methylase
MEISLQRGAIELNGILSGSKSYGRESIIVKNKFGRKIKKKIIYFKKDPSWRDEIAEFANSILKNTLIKNGTSKEALAVMSMIDKIYKDSSK